MGTHVGPALAYYRDATLLGAVLLCVEFKSSIRLQCERMRQFRRNLFDRASRTRREQSIRPKISRIDFDLTELENSQVWSGPPKPVVEFGTAADAERAEPAARGRVADGPRDLAEAVAIC